MKPLSSVIGRTDYSDLCERMTGRSLAEWTEYYAEKRREAIGKGKFRTNRPMSHDKVVEMMSLYGFDGDDFYCKLVHVSEVEKFDPMFKRPQCPTTGRMVNGTILRWFLKPDRIPL